MRLRPPAARLGDKAQIPADAHGCVACPQPAIGPAIAGSPDVLTNNRPAIRQNDPGLHAACCGTNTWNASQGSATVFINNKPAVRQGDQTKHCGGSGRMIEGSSNVIIGGTTTGGGGASGGGGGGGNAGGGGGASGGGGAGSGAHAHAGDSPHGHTAGPGAPAADRPDAVEPRPILVAATWSRDRVPVATAVTLVARCEDLAGKTATFTVRDADDDTRIVATLSAPCGASAVQAEWTTPHDGPPGQFVFTVEADSKEAWSGLLTLINPVEVTLILDDEPADGVRVTLRADPSGEVLTAVADAKGIVRFEQAPLGDYTLSLETEA